MKSKRIMFACIIALIGALGMLGGQAHAITITTYTNLASWQAAAGTATLESFNSQTVREFSSTINESGFNGFSLTGSENGDHVGIKAGTFGAQIDGSNLLGYNNGNGMAGPVINFLFDVQLNAFAFDWRDTDFSDEFQLEVAGLTYTNPPSNDSGSGIGSGFFGIVATDGQFGQATIRHGAAYGGYVEPMGFDNIRMSAVPEPTTMLLFGSGLIGLAGFRRKVKKS